MKNANEIKQDILDNSKLSIYKALICELSFDRASDEINTGEKQFECIDIYTDDSETEYTEEFQDIFNSWYDYFDNKFREYNLIK